MSEPPRRPWYLVIALLTCLIGFGGCGSLAAWGTIERFRGVEVEPPSADLTHEDNRKAAAAAYDRWTAAIQTERARSFPLTVGELVLGLAIFFFSSAAWMGRGGARRALVQLTVAQAALVLATFVMTHRSRSAAIEWQMTVASSKMIEGGQPRAQVEQNIPAIRAISHGATIAALAVQSIVALLVVVALTRPRALAYYDSQDERPNEG
jgi:hypothetical protein